MRIIPEGQRTVWAESAQEQGSYPDDTKNSKKREKKQK